MAEYDIHTTVALTATRAAVFDAIVDVASWLRGCPGVGEISTVAPDGPGDVGRTVRIVLRAPLGTAVTMDLRAVDVDRPRRVVLSVAGDLEGQGVWRLHEVGGLTCMDWDWTVRTSARHGNRVAPLARTAVDHIHARVMRHGLSRLAATVGSPLLMLREQRSRPVRAEVAA